MLRSIHVVRLTSTFLNDGGAADDLGDSEDLDREKNLYTWEPYIWEMTSEEDREVVYGMN